jgi:hypothetical protein
MQLGIVLNTISTVAQVWLVDKNLSRLLKIETLEDLRMQVYFVWRYRLISKALGVISILLMMFFLAKLIKNILLNKLVS